MTKLKMARVAAAASSTLVLTLGVVGFASAHQSNGDWGWSHGQDNSVTTTVKNDNDVNVANNNDQYASSGEAEVKDNKEGGSALSGNATNGNTTGVTVGVTNGDAPAAPAPVADDTNSMTVKTLVDNDNDVVITNNSQQKAHTGEAEVKGNVAGGSATSGNAANSNATTVSVTVTN